MQDKKFSISEAVYKVASWASSHDENKQTVLQVWKNKFEITNEDYLIRFLFLLKDSNEHITEELDQIKQIREETKIKYKKSLKSFNNLISGPNLYNAWNSVKNSCATPEIVAYIAGATDVVASGLTEEKINDETIEDLINRINDVKDHINENIKNSVLKKYLIKELDFMLICIDKFDFVGGVGLEDCTGKILQKCIVNQEKIPPNLLKKLLSIALRTLHILTLLGSASKGFEAMSNASDWLREVVLGMQQSDFLEIKLLEDKSSIKAEEEDEKSL